MHARTKLLWVIMVTGWALPAVGQVRDEIAIPDLPGYVTLKCDFHMHTVFSDGLVWPTIRVEEAYREGLDAIAITDHIEYQPHQADIPTNHNRPHEVAAGLAQQRNVILIRGAEITRSTPPGHFNAIFLDDVNPLDTPDFYDVFKAANEQDAFVFWNHPGWQGAEKGKWGEAQTRLLENGELHGIEVCNSSAYYKEAHQYTLDKEVAFIGTSDVHPPRNDESRTPERHRTITLVFAKKRSAPAIKKALQAKQSAIWYMNQIIGREKHLAPLFEACVEVKPIHYRTDRHGWLEIRNHSEMKLELERTGGPGPGRVTLPPENTALIRVNLPKEGEPQALAYKVTNFLIGVDKPLEVELRIPAAVEEELIEAAAR